MNQVINDFENIYLHDSPVDHYSFESENIELALKFAHIFDEHKDNKVNRTICAKDCKLRLIQVKTSTLRIFKDESESWDIIENPSSNELMSEIVENEKVSDVEFKISGLTKISNWVEWIIKCEEIQLEWEVEGRSWLTRE